MCEKKSCRYRQEARQGESHGVQSFPTHPRGRRACGSWHLVLFLQQDTTLGILGPGGGTVLLPMLAYVLLDKMFWPLPTLMA